MMAGTVQAGEPSYQLHTLGWKAFQHLCLTIVGEVWGQTVEGYFDSHDGGRDGAFYGKWTSRADEALEGSFTIQCKFSSKPSKFLKLSSLNDEIAKAERLAARGLARNYIILGNSGLMGTDAEAIKAAFEGIPNIERCAIYGAERITQYIRESPRLRMLVPRVYGLGDLGQVLDERGYAQAQEILSALGGDLEKFVVTDAYQRSAKALVEHGFVLLLGEPACGKSTIAAALAVGALDEWRCSTLKIRGSDEFVARSNPHEPRQLFWIDDAFGPTQLDLQGTLSWNNAFPHVHAAIRRGAKFIFTSRDYIYKAARGFLKESALPMMAEAQVVIEVEKLAKSEKEQILYNHVRMGTQPSEYKRRIKQFLPIVASHPRFSPEIARRLGNPGFTRNLTASQRGLEEFVARPMEMLQENIRTLDASSRSAIAIVFMRGGLLPSPVTLLPTEESAVCRIGGSTAGVLGALGDLEGSFLIRIQANGKYFYQFKHPTIRDAFAGIVGANLELMDIYLSGTPLGQLLAEISCGEVGIEGVKVIVPEDRYEILIQRLLAFMSTNGENYDRVNRFLAYRCDAVFLKLFVSRDANYVASLQCGSYFDAVSDVSVIARLDELGLLPSSERQRHISDIGKLAVDTPDSGFLSGRLAKFLSADESNAILAQVREELLPDLPYRVDVWTDNFPSSREEPDDYFYHFKNALEGFQSAFAQDVNSLEQINQGIALIDAAIDEINSAAPEPDYGGDFPRITSAQNQDGNLRSIFDDVDH